MHLTLPVTQRIAPVKGVLIHQSRALHQTVRPVLSPPRTPIADTVLDLTQSCASLDDAVAWLCRAAGRGLTTPDALRACAGSRSRVRWRNDLMAVVADIRGGVRSPLEGRYVRYVERAHGLPAADRQVQLIVGGQNRYADNLYRAAKLAVELHGQAAHPPERRWADTHRDNAHATLGIVTLRYSWADVTDRPCEVAAEVGSLLIMRGTAVVLRRCGPACTAAGYLRPVASC